ncbi:MAG: CDP-glycerol--UDP-pyrophosphoryl-N-acetylglucosaminyl-N-acetylmannosamine glycerophosphotransferase [Gammaproteobacteria bacterium]|jgi:cell division inhibitor SulA|nr:CDP-glycerol--UDP-pyrophosphoryl-N-acetylglucosaminyl-N-acetylmannosamine glycerophosphotransferase [Gammaproteobacteria bacterium]MBU0884079.1 CDP-glycerol--UDP-pyrophosphoryl-N-acetylglucosaminyl-N-acetylmannosamine glycerophosphotransferase [Gammaproteobacteria bacterium]MBU0902528.1 CDP-glycerol--UDP-pyrophosphoryl-N-acetylglucosaminyl-N-acetylmannosamine glycerophosphotransferase [Gammaproteobacteria bacterium]MBU1858410.1 CDP-glycerol--UDP-pyrophosphoryl-N-acetylglucosaminyl-N-acetylman
MQFPQSLNRTQLPLFDAFLATTTPPLFADHGELPWQDDENEAFSELSLRGAAGHCLHLLAPVLRQLSENHDERWLTLIAPPSSLTQAWLREAGLNRERILLLHPRGEQSPLELAQQALKLGRSHTVVSWLHPLERQARQCLVQAAHQGKAQSLNISLG